MNQDLVTLQLDARIVVQFALVHAEFPSVPGTYDTAIYQITLAERAIPVWAKAVESVDGPIMVADRHGGPGRLALQKPALGQFVEDRNSNKCHRTDYRATTRERWCGSGIRHSHA